MDTCVPGCSDLSSLSLPEEAGSVRKSKGTAVEEELEIPGLQTAQGRQPGGDSVDAESGGRTRSCSCYPSCGRDQG